MAYKSKYTGEEIENILDKANEAEEYTLPVATSATRGGVKIGYSQNGKNYPVLLNSEKMYVNVPWTDTTYSEATTTESGLVPKLPTSNIVLGSTNIAPAMQVLTGDGKWKAINMGYNPIVNRLQLGYYDNGVGYGDVYVTLPVVTETADGLMSKTDKTKVDNTATKVDGLLGGLNFIAGAVNPMLDTFEVTSDEAALHFDEVRFDVSTGEYTAGTRTVTLGAATTTKAGVMTATDKQKLTQTARINNSQTRASAIAASKLSQNSDVMYLPNNCHSIIYQGKEYVPNTLIDVGSRDLETTAGWVGLDFSGIYDNKTWEATNAIVLKWGSGRMLPVSINLQGNYAGQLCFTDPANICMYRVTFKLDTTTKVITTVSLFKYAIPFTAI